MILGIATLDQEKFKNLIKERTKVVHVSSTNQYYVTVTEKLVEKHVSRRFGSVFDYYVDWIAAAYIFLCSSNVRFWKMTVGMYDSDEKGSKGHIFTVYATFRRYK